MVENNRPKPLFSKTLRPGGKLYYVDVYEGRTGSPYLSICENRKEKDGSFSRIRLFVSPGAVPELRDALAEVHDFLQHLPKAEPAAVAAGEPGQA